MPHVLTASLRDADHKRNGSWVGACCCCTAAFLANTGHRDLGEHTCIKHSSSRSGPYAVGGAAPRARPGGVFELARWCTRCFVALACPV